MPQATDFMGTVMNEFFQQYPVAKLINMTEEATEQAMIKVAKEMGGLNIKTSRIHDSITIDADPLPGWKPKE